MNNLFKLIALLCFIMGAHAGDYEAKNLDAEQPGVLFGQLGVTHVNESPAENFFTRDLGECHALVIEGLDQLSAIRLWAVSKGISKLIPEYFTRLSCIKYKQNFATEKKLLGVIKTFCNLRELDLIKHHSIGDGVLSFLKTLNKLTKLSCKLKSGCEETALSKICTLISLEELHLEGCVTDKRLGYLRALTNLRKLELGHGNVQGDYGYPYEADYWWWGHSDCEINMGLQHISNLLNLEILILFPCKVTDEELRHLVPLQRLVHLELRLHNDSSEVNEITNEGLRHLARLRNLTKLDFGTPANITDVGIQHLSALNDLKDLNLDRCREITDEGFQHLALFHNLNNLNLHFCNISDAGLQHVATLQALTVLELHHNNNITDAGVQHLSVMSALQYLRLSCCKNVTDAGVHHLSSLFDLRDLDLRYCEKVTDAGVLHLSASGDLRLNLSEHRNITDAVLQLLRGRFPRGYDFYRRYTSRS